MHASLREILSISASRPKHTQVGQRAYVKRHVYGNTHIAFLRKEYKYICPQKVEVSVTVTSISMRKRRVNKCVGLDVESRHRRISMRGVQ